MIVRRLRGGNPKNLFVTDDSDEDFDSYDDENDHEIILSADLSELMYEDEDGVIKRIFPLTKEGLMKSFKVFEELIKSDFGALERCNEVCEMFMEEIDWEKKQGGVIEKGLEDLVRKEQVKFEKLKTRYIREQYYESRRKGHKKCKKNPLTVDEDIKKIWKIRR
jgi:hypothetical protein